jgi:aspartate/methionine/tyrosine aminotransferase
VQYNLADSGVHPVTVSELIDGPDAIAQLLETPLHYPAVNGTRRLRDLISNLYDGVHCSNVLVTVGAAEANAIALQSLLEPGDQVIAMEPCYRQLWGLAQNQGCHLTTYHLDPANDWRPDLDQLAQLVGPKTKLITVTNPNNPTGMILKEEEMERIVRIAEHYGCWILADEVYRGTERLSTQETHSFVGRYERVIAVNSLSKAYGLSGLRTGWMVAPENIVKAAWRRHEYYTISTGMLSMTLAEIALSEPVRTRLFARNRQLIRDGYSRIESWIQRHHRFLSIVPPESTALAFVRYAFEMPSIDVARILKDESSVLVAPGDYFGVARHLRITHGLKPAYLMEALGRVGSTLERLARHAQRCAV